MSDMDSLHLALAKLNADQCFKDVKLRGFTKDNLQKLLKSIQVKFTTRDNVEFLKTLVAENRTYVVPGTNTKLEAIIGLWCLRKNEWKTQPDADGYYKTKPRLKSADQIEDRHSSSEAESSSVEASQEKITQSVHTGYVCAFDDDRDDTTIQEEMKEHFKLRQELKNKRCVCVKCAETDRNGWVDDTDGKFYCCTCWSDYNVQKSTDAATQDDKALPQKYSMVMDSPYCSSSETTDDGKTNAKTTDKAPATGSVGNAGIEVKMEPGETSSTPRVIKAATNAKRSEPSGSMFSAFGGIFGALKSKEGPSASKKPKVIRQECPLVHGSGPMPKPTAKKPCTEKDEWKTLSSKILKTILVHFGTQPGKDNQTQMLETVAKYKHGQGLLRESGSHDPVTHKQEGRQGKKLCLRDYLDRYIKGEFQFEYEDVIVKQEKSEPCKAIAKKAKIDHPSCISTFPGESRLRRESRMMQKMTEEPISQQHSDAEPESQEMSQEQLERQEQPESQEMSQEQPESQEQLESQEQPESQIQEPIQAGASQASQSLHFQHHNPDASLNLYNIGASTMQSLDQTQRPAYDST